MAEQDDDGLIERWRYIDDDTGDELVVAFENEKADSPRTVGSIREFRRGSRSPSPG